MWRKCCGDAWVCRESDIRRYLCVPSFPKHCSDHRNVLGVFTVGCCYIVRCLAFLLWWRQSTHSLLRSWSAGMPVPPLHQSMASEVLALIHVINSVKPCLKAPHTSQCSQRWPAITRCGKHSSCLFSLSSTSMSLSAGVDGETISTWHQLKHRYFHFKQEWALIQMSVNRLTHNRGRRGETKSSIEQGVHKKKQAVKRHPLSVERHCLVYNWFYSQCFDKGLLSKLWNLLSWMGWWVRGSSLWISCSFVAFTSRWQC